MLSQVRCVLAHSSRRIWTLFPVLVALCLLISFHPQAVRNLKKSSWRTTCVYVMGYQNVEGIGQTLLRNQFAVFVAQIAQSRLAFPDHKSEHGYNYADIFDRCDSLEEEALPKNEKANSSHQCILQQEDLLIERCARGNCGCLKTAVMKHVRPLARRCTTIGVEHNRFKTQEYSGCIGDVLRRYLSGPNRWRKPYNAIHYRQGDLAEKRNKADFWLLHLNNMVSFMCKYSDLDIIIVTQGQPEIPICGKRVVLASNTSEREAFSIIQHARWVGLEISGFALAMAQIANPERVLMPDYAIPYYDWLRSPKWTVFSKTGAAFSFDNIEDVRRAVYHPKALDARTHRHRYSRKYLLFETEVPYRLWQQEALPPGTKGVF